MDDRFFEAITNYTTQYYPAFCEYVKEHYGENVTTPEEIIRFAQLRSGFVLPDEFFFLDKQQNINISIHNISANNIEHSHDFFELVYVARGAIVDCVDGVTLKLSTGAVCVHNPRATHQITQCTDNDCLINIMIRKETFEKNVFLPIIQDTTLNRFFLRYSAVENNFNYMAFHAADDRIDSIIELIIKEFLDQQSNERLIVSLIFLLFGTLLKNFKAEPFVDQLLVYLSDHIENATLSNCARHFCYHEKYLTSVVKKHTGKSFKEILTELRIRKASDLLAYTDRTVSDIAYAVGYKDPATFYLNFKKVLGCTPNDFRTQRKQ